MLSPPFQKPKIITMLKRIGFSKCSFWYYGYGLDSHSTTLNYTAFTVRFLRQNILQNKE